MRLEELFQLITRGEDSRHQFKRDITNCDSLSAVQASFTDSDIEALEERLNATTAPKQMVMVALLTRRTRLATFGAPA